MSGTVIGGLVAFRLFHVNIVKVCGINPFILFCFTVKHFSFKFALEK